MSISAPHNTSQQVYQLQSPMSYSRREQLQPTNSPTSSLASVHVRNMSEQQDQSRLADIRIYDPQHNSEQSPGIGAANTSSLSPSGFIKDLENVLNVKKHLQKEILTTVDKGDRTHRPITKPYFSIYNKTTNTVIHLSQEYVRIVKNANAERKHMFDGYLATAGATVTHGLGCLGASVLGVFIATPAVAATQGLMILGYAGGCVVGTCLEPLSTNYHGDLEIMQFCIEQAHYACDPRD